MSKDRQQRREQQASGTRTGDQIVVTAQPTSTGKDVEAAVAEFERAASEALERAPTRTPAEIIEHAERLRQRAVFAEGEKDMAAAASADRDRSDDCADVEQRMHSAPPKPPANIPKAVHHLRRAASMLPSYDSLRGPLDCCITVLLGVPVMPERVTGQPIQAVLPVIASALEMDAHGGAQAAKDVRAAIEALS